jgi:DNA replication regulator DPB11
LTGATYDEQLSAKTSVIVCNTRDPNVQKLKFATDRRIPAVHAAWLWDCLRSSQLQPYGKYQLNTIALPHQQKSNSKSRPRAAAEIPAVAKPSIGDGALRPKKIDQVTKKSAKPSGPQRPLDLALSADATPASTTDSVTRANTTNNGSVFDDDGDFIPGLDGPASLPLQNISANSPRRPSITSLDSKPISRDRSSSAESLIRPVVTSKARPVKEPNPDSVIPADSAIPIPTGPPAPAPQEPAAEKDYSDILAQLRANRKPLPSPADQASTTRRRGRRQLGRATSTRSNDSGAESSGQLNLDGDDDKVQAQEYQPSQELGWDSPGAAKARETMMKRLGGRLEERSVRVEGIGVVRDVASEGGGRVVRKRREKGV